MRRELIPAAAASRKGQCVIWEGVTSPSAKQATRCSKHLTFQMPGLSHFGKFWTTADPQIAVALRGSPFTCVDGYLYPCSVRLGRGGGVACGPTVTRVARGDGTGLGAIRGGDQVKLCLPDLVSGLGDKGTGMCRTVKECGSPGGCLSCLSLSPARVASVRWLVSVGAALLWQVLLCELPKVVGCQKRGGDNISL